MSLRSLWVVVNSLSSPVVFSGREHCWVVAERRLRLVRGLVHGCCHQRQREAESSRKASLSRMPSFVCWFSWIQRHEKANFKSKHCLSQRKSLLNWVVVGQDWMGWVSAYLAKNYVRLSPWINHLLFFVVASHILMSRYILYFVT